MYTTLAKVKTALGATTMNDEDIQEVINLVSGYIDSYVGYNLGQLSTRLSTFYVDGSGTEYLMLPSALNGSWLIEDTENGESLVLDENIVSYPQNKPYTEYLGKKRGKFGKITAQYKITGAVFAKYAVSWENESFHTLPAEITGVATKLAVNTCKAGGLEISGNKEKAGKVTSETIGSYTVSYASNNMESILAETVNGTAILNHYKKKITIA